MKYSEKTLEYYENIKNMGSLDEDLPNVGTGIVGSPLCGDVMKLQLSFDEQDRITDAKFKVFGCVSAIASMEKVTTLLKGMSIDEALKIKNADVANSLELSEIKKHCSVLAKEAIEAAVKNYQAKKNKETDMITVSEKATAKIKELLAENKSVGITISVISGGCSGIDYTLAYEAEEDANKAKVVVNGVNFYFDPALEILIKGTTIDIVENSFGHGFVVTDKNHVGCCNCNGSCGR